MKKLNGLFSKGLAGKLIRFVIIFVLGLGLVFFVMLYVQTSLLKKAVKDEEVSRLNLIQGEYRQSMDEYNEDSLLQLNIWAADKTDDDFWIVEHDMKSLGLQVEDVFRHPDHYARIPVKEPRKENIRKP